MKNITGIILAAGEGTRMNSSVPKVLHNVGGRPMLKCILSLLDNLGVEKRIVVVGHQADKVKKIIGPKDKTIKQTKLLGSGNALWQTKSHLCNFKGSLLVLYGDIPLVSYQSLKELIQTHTKNQSSCTFLTAVLRNPTGFGRIIRDEENRVVKIIEEQDADAYEKAVREINVGAYCFKTKDLFAVLAELRPDNAKKEYYLTDAIKALFKKKVKIEAIAARDEEEAFGVNSRYDLCRANDIVNKRAIERLISCGVTVLDPRTTYIWGDIEVGRDTVIYPHTVIEGRIKIGRACRIGPFAHLRSATVLEDGVQIGNFVELVRTRVGTATKIKHHSYIGDAIVGKKVNIGAGTITANYDGKNKNCTIIEDGAFIGVGSILIAPVRIGKGAIVGAGSVVTKNKDVTAGITVAGVPARVLKKKKQKGEKNV